MLARYFTAALKSPFRWNLTLFATILLTLQMKTRRGRGILGQHRKALARFASRAWTAAPPPPSLRHRGSSELKILMFSFRQRLVEVESWFVTSSVAPAAIRHPESCRQLPALSSTLPLLSRRLQELSAPCSSVRGCGKETLPPATRRAPA